MAKEKPVKGIYSNQKKVPDLDCAVCLNRAGCEMAAEGKFCGRFRSRQFDPAEKGVDPNWLWEHGEEVEF